MINNFYNDSEDQMNKNNPADLTFSAKDMQITSEKVVYKGFFTMKEIIFNHALFNGGRSKEVKRELMYKGHAVAIIAYDPILDNLIMIEQIRIGAYVGDRTKSPWQLELVAGMVEKGEQLHEVAHREAEEEAGLKLTNLTDCFSVWDSPGGMVEKIHMVAACVDSSTAGGIYGLASENEDIKVRIFKRSQAYQLMQDGIIDNSIAVMGILWLELNYTKLQQQWIK